MSAHTKAAHGTTGLTAANAGRREMAKHRWFSPSPAPWQSAESPMSSPRKLSGFITLRTNPFPFSLKRWRAFSQPGDIVVIRNAGLGKLPAISRGRRFLHRLELPVEVGNIRKSRPCRNDGDRQLCVAQHPAGMADPHARHVL